MTTKMSTATRRTVRTRICIISDTHDSTPPLPQSDVLIHSGDLTATGRYSQLLPQLNHIASAPAELKLVIAGNHDITLDREYYSVKGKDIHKFFEDGDVESVDACLSLWKNDDARGTGVRYLEEGMSIHSLSNGAEFRVYASPYQVCLLRFHVILNL